MIKYMYRGLFLLFLILFGFASTSMAQGFGSPEERAERMKAQIDNMVDKLGIEGEKADQVRGILTIQAEEQVAIFQAYAGQRDRNARSMMREEMQTLQASTEEKLAVVLSEEEMVRFKEAVAEAEQQRRAQFRGRGPGNPN